MRTDHAATSGVVVLVAQMQFSAVKPPLPPCLSPLLLARMPRVDHLRRATESGRRHDGRKELSAEYSKLFVGTYNNGHFAAALECTTYGCMNRCAVTVSDD